jgi:ribosomal protein L20
MLAQIAILDPASFEAVVKLAATAAK